MNHVFITHEWSYKTSHNGLEILSTQFGEKLFPGQCWIYHAWKMDLEKLPDGFLDL